VLLPVYWKTQVENRQKYIMFGIIKAIRMDNSNYDMIGRKLEVGKMNRLLKSGRSEFLAVTGRRRVGKTYLIDEVFRKHYCFSMTGIQKANQRKQLVNFAVKLSEYDGSGTPQPMKNWQAAFLQFKAYLQTLDKNKKHVIFIDELPWVATPRAGFVQLLAHLWNDYLSKESHFLLVVCGSATSWVARNIVNDSGGLHNRLTELIHLYPFTLPESKAYLKKNGLRFTDQEIAKVYMALGGIPYYLQNIKRGESSPVAIERICFAPTGLLRNEYDNLYKALFKNANLYQEIIAVLASHPNGMPNARIVKKLGIKVNGSYHRAMKDLIASDFVRETHPFGRKKRGSFFRLIDEYSVFYHRFIAPNRNYTSGIWQQLAASQSYKTWTGYAFESICFQHIDLIKRALGIGAVTTDISSINVSGSGQGEGFQIDMLIDRRDDCIHLCEMKFHAGPFTITKEYYRKLIRKRQLFIEHTGTRKQVIYTFISNHGIAENEYALEVVDVELTLADILNA
jgi:hypothetical protein